VIEPQRLYTLEDIAKLTRLDPHTVQNLLKVGLFDEPVKKPNLIAREAVYVEGRSVRAALNEMVDHKLLIQIVREVFSEQPIDLQLDYVEELTELLKEEPRASELAKDIGIVEPFYVIPDERVDVFKTYLVAQGFAQQGEKSYGEIIDGGRHLFAFSLRVPRVEREHPETYYFKSAQFLDLYLRRDTSARVRSYYIPEQHRIVGVVLSFDPGLLNQAFQTHGFPKANSLPSELYGLEFPLLRSTPIGHNALHPPGDHNNLYKKVLV